MADFAKAANDEIRRLRAALREAEAQRDALAGAYNTEIDAHDKTRGRAEALAAALRPFVFDTGGHSYGYDDCRWCVAEQTLKTHDARRALAGEPRHTDECRFQHGSGKWECRPDCPTLVAEPEREASSG